MDVSKPQAVPRVIWASSLSHKEAYRLLKNQEISAALRRIERSAMASLDLIGAVTTGPVSAWRLRFCWTESPACLRSLKLIRRLLLIEAVDLVVARPFKLMTLSAFLSSAGFHQVALSR